MLLLFSLSMTVVFMVSCAGKENYGQLAPNDKVKNTFETYQLSPDYKYYYSCLLYTSDAADDLA